MWALIVFVGAALFVTGAVMGAVLQHPPHCRKCGEPLTYFCPVCCDPGRIVLGPGPALKPKPKNREVCGQYCGDGCGFLTAMRGSGEPTCVKWCTKLKKDHTGIYRCRQCLDDFLGDE